jgi:serine phosphatase RsbU (regulator of sigma subunit)
VPSARALLPSATPINLRSRARRRVARPAVAAAGFLAARASLTAASGGSQGTGGATARTHRASAKPHARPSTIATTVTKIINVVPAAMRIVIAALIALALALAVSSRVAALRARRLMRQRRELLADVGLLQAALLPELPGRIGPVGTSAAYRPASGPGAGGDFYDVFALGDGRLAVIVGDVSGHGREALPHTTLMRFTLRAYLEAGLSPRGALQAATPVLERQLSGSFATVVLATYHPRERTLVYASAGHPPPVVAGSEALALLTVCSSPPIGAGQPTGRRQTVISVPGRALACFYTDGVVEARVGRRLFGLSRLRSTLAAVGPKANAAALLEQVAQESDTRPDDMAACLLRIEGEELAPRVSVEEIELDRRDLLRGRAARFLKAAGVEAEEAAEALRSLRSLLAQHGAAVVELQMGEGSPQVSLRPNNVAQLSSGGRQAASVG